MNNNSFLERLNLKIVDLSGDFGNASLKLSIELAKKDKDGSRSSVIYKSTFNSTRYNKSIPVESLSFFPNWYLILECKSKKDSSIVTPQRDNIMILPNQIYRLIDLLKVMKETLVTKKDLFIANGNYLSVNPKYNGAGFIFRFGLPNSPDNLKGEPVPYCEYEGAMEKPAFLLMLNGDYSVSFYMTLDDINGVLYLLERIDFVSMVMQVTSTLGVTDNNIKTFSRKSNAMWGIELNDLTPTRTVVNGEGDNIVKKLKSEKENPKGIKVLWD